MDYGLIGKIEKAKRYAEERDRIHFNDFTVTMTGENNSHTDPLYGWATGNVIVISSKPANAAAIPWHSRSCWIKWSRRSKPFETTLRWN